MTPNTILIVEPDATSRSSTREMLEREGFAVLEASGAEQALAVVNRSEITLVITELYLTTATERCLVPAIRQSSALRRMKVLAYTRHGRAADRAWAIAEGADGYVLKKNGSPRLLEVMSHLSTSPSRRSRSRDATRRRRAGDV